MPTAPGFDFKSFFFTIADGSETTRNLSPFVTSMDGLPGENELQDTTKVTDSGHTFTRTLWNAAFTISGVYSKSTDGSGPDAILQSLISMTTATVFEAGPAGGSTELPTDQRYSGLCFLRGYNTPGRVGSVVTFDARFQSVGVIAISSGNDWRD